MIGNPGLGQTVLNHTMTEGIVSNPRRTIRGGTYIQTSAAVNPGSSGGPMFDVPLEKLSVADRKFVRELSK